MILGLRVNRFMKREAVGTNEERRRLVQIAKQARELVKMFWGVGVLGLAGSGLKCLSIDG